MSAIIINPGSGPIVGGDGWTNTYAGAKREALRWLAEIHKNVSPDIEIVDTVEDSDGEGRWNFRFRHTVTSVEITLTTHGIDDVKAYEKDRIFYPRVYWNGSSCSDPELNQWKADGFVPTFREVVADA